MLSWIENESQDPPANRLLPTKMNSRLRLHATVLLLLLHALASARESERDLCMKLREVLTRRLQSYHPVEKGFSLFLPAEPLGDQPRDDYSGMTYEFMVDSVRDPAQRLPFNLELREYASAAAAEKAFWQLRETSANPGPLFENTRGFDVLALQPNSLKGLLGARTFELSPIGRRAGSDPFATRGDGKPNPDTAWYAGMAAFIMDVWKETQGLPHSGQGIVQVDPGPLKRSPFEGPEQNLDTLVRLGLLSPEQAARLRPPPAASSSPLRHWPWLAVLTVAAAALLWLLRRRKRNPQP